MIRPLIPIVLILTALATFTGAQQDEKPEIAVYFSPNGGAAKAVIDEIDRAKESLDVAAYTITHSEIARAIIHAHERGVRVRVIMDRSQAGAKYSAATPLMNAGIIVRTKPWKKVGEGLLHHKFAVVDSQIVITGSMNWTRKGDESNSEDLIVIQDERVERAYAEQFTRLMDASEAMKKK